MKLIDTIELPEWALCPIFNDDYSGLNSEDEEQIRDFLESFDECNPVTFEVVDGGEREFNPFPEFGLACSTVTVNVWTS